MEIITSVLFCLSPCLDYTTLRRLAVIVTAILITPDRVSMLGMSRWTDKGGNYRTIQRFFKTKIDWAKVQWVFIRFHLRTVPGIILLTGDEVVTPKSGKQTYGWVNLTGQKPWQIRLKTWHWMRDYPLISIKDQRLLKRTALKGMSRLMKGDLTRAITCFQDIETAGTPGLTACLGTGFVSIVNQDACRAAFYEKKAKHLTKSVHKPQFIALSYLLQAAVFLQNKDNAATASKLDLAMNAPLSPSKLFNAWPFACSLICQIR
ncbi:transposase [uncultured Desulfobacter sp.]|uniref:transposase n=1 Tax=uncultured Desulfobacter sp. TaxID=240139 RepID=UPI002AAAE035|nr:transposase [uncultured Desulfobacter sp.]